VRKIIPYFLGLFLGLSWKGSAQRVLYTQFPSHISGLFQIVGKTKDLYWLETRQDRKSNSLHENFQSADLKNFILLDSKLHTLTEYPAVHLKSTLKQWLYCDQEGLNQIIASNTREKTYIFCSRYRPDLTAGSSLMAVDSLPFSADASSLLLVRSEDQSKILLVAFENSDSALTRVHALLFNADWTSVYHRIIAHEQFAQPCIQDDPIGFPGESFDDLPIKLANNGEWLMVAPSRISCNFSIFHVGPLGSQYYFHEIPLSPFYSMEDIAMSVDNEQQAMSVGLLSSFSNSSLKNVQVFQYSMKEGKIIFDSSFHFNTQYRALRSRNLYHEKFVAIPGRGYLLMMEYGKPYEFQEPAVPAINYWESAFLLSHYAEMDLGKQSIQSGYTPNSGLRPIPTIVNQGDLNLFYFPSVAKDSSWSSVLESEQHAENNNPDLSYLVMADGKKIYLLYNQIDGYSNVIPTATILGSQGNATDEPLVFWQLQKTLNFQDAHRYSSDEVYIPYDGHQAPGFALIRLK
jgi:hypothetical protein